MSVALETNAALPVETLAAPDERDAALDTRENIIAAHRQALVELAPHQAWRSVREDTAWHMEKLGLLLRMRETTRAGEEEHDRHITR